MAPLLLRIRTRIHRLTMLRTLPLSILTAVALSLLGCQHPAHPPSTQSYRTSATHSVRYPYTPPPGSDYSYQDRQGHRYSQPGLNSSHGGYGAYGVLRVED